MSAFVVSRNHIRYLIEAAITADSRFDFSWSHQGRVCKLQRGQNCDAVGQMLWNHNIASVKARYPDCTADDMPGPLGEDFIYTHQPMAKRVKPIQVLKAIHCYEYQACEADDWEESSAKAFCESLRSDIIRNLPGYEHAAWEID